MDLDAIGLTDSEHSAETEFELGAVCGLGPPAAPR